MKKILIISPTPSDTSFAGNRLRIIQIGEMFRNRGYKAIFLHIGRESTSDAERATMKNRWDGYYELSYHRSNERNPTTVDNFELDEWISPEIFKKVKAINDLENPDIILVNYVFLSIFCTLAKQHQISIIDTHDAFANRFDVLKKMDLPKSFFSTSLANEKRGLSRADIVLSITEEDANFFNEQYNISSIIIGYTEKNNKVATHDARLPVGYLAGSNKINVKAIISFIESFKPHTTNPPTTLLIGGTICNDPEIISISSANKATIKLAGIIKEKSDFYEQVGLVINPQKTGTGQKIKTVEALSFGTPVVSFHEGLKGICDQAHPFVARDDQDAKNRIINMRCSPSDYTQYKDLSNSVWESYQEQLDRNIDQLFSTIEKKATRASNPSSPKKRTKILIVVDFPFWKDANGKSSRVSALVASAPDFIDLHVFVFVSVGRLDKALISEKFPHATIHSFKEYQHGGDVVEEPSLLKKLIPLERTKYSRDYYRSFQRFLEENSFDWAIIEYLYLSYLRHAVNFPERKVLDTHDVMHLRESTFEKFDKKHWISVSPKDELSLFSEYDLVLTIQYEEQEYLRRHLGERAKVVPHLPDLVKNQEFDSQSYLHELQERPLKLGFIGTSSPMNIDGIRHILPSLESGLIKGQIQLTIAGNICGSLPEFAGISNLNLAGVVNDLSEFYSSIDLLINPCYYGGGLKIKTIESIAHGVPVIGAFEAFRGMPLDGNGEVPFIYTETTSGFAAAIFAITQDPSRLLALKAHCRPYINRYFSSTMYARFWDWIKP